MASLNPHQFDDDDLVTSQSHAAKIIESAYTTALLRSLQSAGVKFLRYFAVDVCNTVRCKAVPIDHLLRNSHDITTMTSTRTKTTTLNCQVSIAQVCFAGLPSYADNVIEGTGFDAKHVLVIQPDLFSLCILPYAPKTALVLGTLHDQSSGSLSPLCTRGLLANVVRDAASRINLAFVGP
jgi:glutamine synthetase